VTALPKVFRMAVGQVEIVPFDASALSARTYSGSVLALPSRAWRSLICSMVNMTDAVGRILRVAAHPPRIRSIENIVFPTRFRPHQEEFQNLVWVFIRRQALHAVERLASLFQKRHLCERNS
jgi:hypothetical protein